MILRRYVKDKYKGISLGLEYPYRAKKIRNQFVIYRMSDGKIIEKLPKQKIDAINFDKMSKRLHKLNELEIKLEETTKDEIDSEN